MAGMSGISKDCEPGASTSTARVFGLNSFSMPRADQRIEIGGLDAIAGQQAVAEIARGPVHIVADQDVVARLAHREQGGRDRRKSGGRKADAGALRPFQRHQRVLQRAGGRRTVAAILVFAPMGVEILGGRIKHRGTVHHRRIDEPLLRLGVAACRHQSGFGLLRVCLSGAVGGIHAFPVLESSLQVPTTGRAAEPSQVKSASQVKAVAIKHNR